MAETKINLTRRRTDAELNSEELNLLQAIAGQGSNFCGSDDPAVHAMMKSLCDKGLLKPTCFLDLNSKVGKAKITTKYTATAAGRRRCVVIK